MPVTLTGTVPNSFLAASAATIAATRVGILPGSLIVVAAECDDTTTITNVSDGTTTVAVPDIALDIVAITERIALYSFPNHAGGTFTFTVTYSASASFRGIAVIELIGADSAAPKEGTASATGTSAAPASGNVAPNPTVDGEYLVGFCAGTGVLTVAGGAVDLANDPTVTLCDVSGFAQAVAAAKGAAWTQASGAWGAICASYKPAPATGGKVILTEGSTRLRTESGLYLLT